MRHPSSTSVKVTVSERHPIKLSAESPIKQLLTELSLSLSPSLSLSLSLRAQDLTSGEKTVFLSHSYIKMIFLPRQARDKHREKLKKERVQRQTRVSYAHAAPTPAAPLKGPALGQSEALSSAAGTRCANTHGSVLARVYALRLFRACLGK